MATESKLKDDIKKLETALNSKATSEKIKPKLKNQLAILKAELSALQKPAASKMSRAKQLRAKYKALYGVRFQGIDIEKDADIPARAFGKRTSQGLKGNQYASKKQAKGHTYYEYRENRIDMKQPPKKYPKLEDGGYMAKGGELTPYIIWVSKDGNKREFYGEYKSMRAANMKMDKLWESGEYKNIGNKPKSKYEKEGFYEDGGMMAKGGEIGFQNSNLYLNGFGIDSNGNSVIKVSFPNQRAFSIQTNGVLKETNNKYTKKIKDLSDADLKIIEKEVVDYVKEFGSKEQKSKLNSYEDGGLMNDGRDIDSDVFDKLKKGDKIHIIYPRGQNFVEKELLVKSKNLVGKGKSYESEKITFTDVSNPNGVNFFAYKRKSGFVGFAQGDSGMPYVQIKDKMEDGGMMAKGGIYSSDDTWVVTFENQDTGEFEEVTVRANNKTNAIATAEDESGLSDVYQYYSVKKSMAKGGMSQGYDDREDERLAMKYGKMKSKYLNSTKARRDDARFEDRMEDGGMMAKGGLLKVDDYVWNALGKKLIVNKVTNDEYYLSSFGQSSDSPFSKKKVDGYIKSGDWSLKPKMADGGMMAKGGEFPMANSTMIGKMITVKLPNELESFKDKVVEEYSDSVMGKKGFWSKKYIVKKSEDGGMMEDGGEVGEGFLIREMNEKLKRMFPDTFGFTVGNVSKEGNKTLNSAALIVDENDPYRGLEDKDIQSKLFFPQYKRDHNINFRVMQGGENTYFYFALESEKGDEYIGQFGFKDRGDVPSSYITRFIAFLMEQYALPFSIKHSVMADGGMMADGGEVNGDNMEMVVSQIKAIKHHAEELSKIVTSSTPIEAWVVAKIERSETDLSDVTHYLDGLKMEHGGRVTSSQHRLNR